MTDRAASSLDQTQGITIEKRHAAGIVTLARAHKRNALTAAMTRTLALAYPQFARDPIIYAAIVRSAGTGVFSAGADLDEVAVLCAGDRDAARAAVGDAIGLCWLHEAFTKPTISLINGMVIGSGFGLGLHGTHRVAGEGYAFACPETGIGLVPAGGICHVLARLPGSIGCYLALTGTTIRRADAFRLGLVTHCLPANAFDGVVRELADAEPVDSILDPAHGDPGPGELAVLEAVIARCFSAPSVEEILVRLDAEGGVHATWAEETAARLRRRSPLALKVTRRLLAEAATLDLRELLMLEHRVLCSLMAAPGAGRRSCSSPARCRLDEITAAHVRECFSNHGSQNLALPTRAEMQTRGGKPGVSGATRR